MKPLTDTQIWGLEEPTVEIECPLLIDGKCPLNCNRCDEFAREMENLATENTEVTEK